MSITVDYVPASCVQSYIMSSYPQLERVYAPFSPRTSLSPYIPPGERLERLFLLLCLSDAAHRFYNAQFRNRLVRQSNLGSPSTS